MIVRRKQVDPALPEDGHHWGLLDPHAEYRVIGIEYDSYRIQSSEDDWPCLYSAELFDIMDPRVEPEWVVEYINESFFVGFPQFAEAGFWEDVHDGRHEALQELKPVLDRLGIKHP
ncbi:MAG: hypothetical protein LAT64_10510 [Phycisphaerales bacterium]|nr:hypothetical protein [Planctomycetota bacterium]MCH8509183.1 hypothetical protein [Phycisphaerales bacterium]